MKDIFESNDNFEDAPEDTKPTPEQLEQEQFDAGLSTTREEIQVEIPAAQFQLSEKDWNDIAEKASKFTEAEKRLQQIADKNSGSIGTILQQIEELKQSRAGEPTQISKDSFAGVRDLFNDWSADEEFSDKLSEKLAEEISKINLGGNGHPPKDYDDRISKLEQSFELKILTLKHPDWKSVVEKPEFATWQLTLSEEGKAEIAALASEKWDGLQAAKAIDGFKAWENRKAEADKKKADRLADAVPIKTGGSTHRTSVISEEDAFNAGMALVQKQRKI